MRVGVLKKAHSTALTLVLILGLTVFGFSGIGWAASYEATIHNTGPDSLNEISFENKFECEVENNNNIDINSDVHQEAETGNASVSGNTSASGWGEWDPVTWQNKGYSYDQWQAAFVAYVASNQASWQSNWGSLAGSGGATSGNASNTNNVEVGVAIENGGCESGHDIGPGGEQFNNPAEQQSSGSVLGDNVSGGSGGSGSLGALLGIFNPYSFDGSSSVDGSGNSNGTHNPSSPNNPHNPNNPSATSGCAGVIDTTGPGSSNSISCANQTEVTVTNNNNVTANASSGQTANSGTATSADNGGAGGAESGDAANSNSTALDFGTTN